MPKPLVSIVTPTYNQQKFVGDTVESVLAQTYPKIEYIVLDDGSTDKTPDIVRRYVKEPKVKIVRHENMGQTATINKGWAMSRGDIIAWLNSDDLLTPNAVEHAVDALATHPNALMVYGDCDNIDADGSFHSRYPCKQESLESLLFNENSIGIAQPSTFLRRKVLFEVGFLDPLIYWCMDLDYWCRVALKGELVYMEGSAWSQYRIHVEAKTSAQLSRSAPDFIYVYRKLCGYGGMPWKLKKRSREIIAHGHWIAARRFRYGGAKDDSKREAWKSLLLAPNRQLDSKLRLILGRG